MWKIRWLPCKKSQVSFIPALTLVFLPKLVVVLSLRCEPDSQSITDLIIPELTYRLLKVRYQFKFPNRSSRRDTICGLLRATNNAFLMQSKSNFEGCGRAMYQQIVVTQGTSSLEWTLTLRISVCETSVVDEKC